MSQISTPTVLGTLTGFVIAGLLLFAGAIILHVMAAGPGKRPSMWESFAWARGLIWALPVLAVMAFLVGRAAPRFQEPAESTAAPEELRIELNDPEGLKVEVETETELTSTGELKKTPKPGLPEWTANPTLTDGETTRLVLVSHEHPTKTDADKEIEALAAARIRSDFEKTHRTSAEWSIPAKAIQYGRSFDEAISRQAGNVSFEMVRIHRELVINEETRKAAFGAFRASVFEQRVWGLGAILGMATLIAAGSSLYLRLDSRTHGQYRTRLKAATVAALTAGGLLLTAMV